MLEILNFVFRDFWTFCGVVILLYTIGVFDITAPLGAIACCIHGERKNKNKDKEKRNDE